MDAFADNFDQTAAVTVDVDPAAEFLAREKDQLAGLEDLNAESEVVPVSTQAAIISGLDSDNAHHELSGSFEMINNELEQPEVSVFNNGSNIDTAELNDVYTTVSIEDANDEHIFAGEALSSRSFNYFDEEYVPATPIVREEPEKIRKWREEQKTRLEQKDLEEEVKFKELREQARKERDDWYKHHEDSIRKTKASNRNAEKQFVAETDAIEPGTEWERIAKLCDFNPKSNKCSRDVSRMRSIILQLKQNPIASKA